MQRITFRKSWRMRHHERLSAVPHDLASPAADSRAASVVLMFWLGMFVGALLASVCILAAAFFAGMVNVEKVRE